MYKNILIPVALDHETIVDRKIEIAKGLLSEGGRITLLTVLENVPGFVVEFVDMKPENNLTQKVLARLQDVAGGSPEISCEVTTGSPGITISHYANDNDVDLVIVGSHKPGLQDYFLGSTAARVTRRAKCSVLVVR